MTIVRSTYRYKRPPRKRKAVALQVPIVVKAGKRAEVASDDPTAPEGADMQSNAATTQARPAIVTAKNPRRGRFGDVPDMTPEEVNQRRDAADALWRELIRRVREE